MGRGEYTVDYAMRNVMTDPQWENTVDKRILHVERLYGRSACDSKAVVTVLRHKARPGERDPGGWMDVETVVIS